MLCDNDNGPFVPLFSMFLLIIWYIMTFLLFFSISRKAVKYRNSVWNITFPYQEKGKNGHPSLCLKLSFYLYISVFFFLLFQKVSFIFISIYMMNKMSFFPNKMSFSQINKFSYGPDIIWITSVDSALVYKKNILSCFRFYWISENFVNITNELCHSPNAPVPKKCCLGCLRDSLNLFKEGPTSGIPPTRVNFTLTIKSDFSLDRSKSENNFQVSEY